MRLPTKPNRWPVWLSGWTSFARPTCATRWVLIVSSTCIAGCRAVRELRISSEPSQAEVRLDGERVGTTPCFVPFEHYGTRRLTVYLPGYRTHSERVVLTPPWYGRFPLDIFSEVLFPFGWRDIREMHVPLDTGGDLLLEPDLPAILRRADALRHAGPDGPQTPPVGTRP